MRPTRALLFALCALTAVAGLGADEESEYERMWAARETENARLIQNLDALEPARFYRLDGGPKNAGSGPSGTFHDVPVLAAAAAGDAASRDEFKASLRRVLKSSDGGESACFFPRHGVRLSDGNQQYDIVLCFECNAFVVYGPDGKRLYKSGFSAHEEAANWDAVFTAAGVVIPAREIAEAPR